MHTHTTCQQEGGAQGCRTILASQHFTRGTTHNAHALTHNTLPHTTHTRSHTTHSLTLNTQQASKEAEPRDAEILASQQEYRKGVSAWKFDLPSLKAAAAAQVRARGPAALSRSPG